MPGVAPGIPDILAEVAEERARQDAKWGEQNHPNVCPILAVAAGPERFAEEYEIPTADRAKFICDSAFKAGRPAWAPVAVEELAEAVEQFALGNVKEGRAELVQAAAVLVAWIECIDRKNSN